MGARFAVGAANNLVAGLPEEEDRQRVAADHQNHHPEVAGHRSPVEPEQQVVPHSPAEPLEQAAPHSPAGQLEPAARRSPVEPAVTCRVAVQVGQLAFPEGLPSAPGQAGHHQEEQGPLGC